MTHRILRLHLAVTAAFIVLVGAAPSTLSVPVKSVVLVHGAWVDGSGWKPVYDILTNDGYNVSMVPVSYTHLKRMNFLV